nr:WbqC family protein [uncultured Flavobacterium sp.]
MKKVAVMQPYFVPYIGYFQMIKAVDVFVFYDDVNYIKGGWINRNRIKVGNEAKYFTVPLINSSPNRLIKDIEVKTDSKEFLSLRKTIIQNYSKAPYFKTVMPLIDRILLVKEQTISNLAIDSIKIVCDYLKITTKFKVSSIDYSVSKGLERTERLFNICEELNASHYINAIGGFELYDKNSFSKKRINLSFIKSKPISYTQLKGEFLPWLSIIDVLMFNSLEDISLMMDQYELV